MNAWVGAARINVFTVIHPRFLDKQFDNTTASRQPRGKLFRVGDNCAGGGCQFPMLSTGKIDRKCKLLADSNETAGNVRPRDRAQIPRIQK